MGSPGHSRMGVEGIDAPGSTPNDTLSAQESFKDGLPSVCAIPLLPLESGLVALVDMEDFDALACHDWRALKSNPNGRTTYAVRYHRHGSDPRNVYMHRQILGLADDEAVDHINANGLDNRRCNLRVATDSQNMANRRKRNDRECSSQFKGVSRTGTKARPWVALICGKYLGSFVNEEDAARAYDTAAVEKWGEFARTNFARLLVAFLLFFTAPSLHAADVAKPALIYASLSAADLGSTAWAIRNGAQEGNSFMARDREVKQLAMASAFLGADLWLQSKGKKREAKALRITYAAVRVFAVAVNVRNARRAR